MERTLALAACLILGALLGWWGEQGPRPLPASAPAEAFAAGRALADVEIIARAPHPTGTDANAAVRDHLVGRLRQLGLDPQVQVARPFMSRQIGGKPYVVGARVENVIGVLPGRDPTAPALALMAHYDSVPRSPGAGDDAAGVAAALEIARALKARGQTERDVILLLTDGEELGLLGARAFFDGHPLASRVGFLINMEARGSAGRATMFQTGPANGPTIERFVATSPGSPSNSLAVFAYEQMPNDTDFSVSKDAGVPGLNFAFTGGQFDYHSPTASVETLSRRSLQDLGRQALAATVAIAYADTLPGAGPDKVYAPVFGGEIIAYDPPVGWGVLAASALLLLIGVFRAARQQTADWRDAAQGALAGLYILTAGAAVLRFARRAATGPGYMEYRELLAQAHRFETVLVLLGLGVVLLAAAAAAKGRMRVTTALVAGAAGLGCQVFGGWDPVGLGLGAAGVLLAVIAFGREARRAGAWAGLLAVGLAAGVALQAAAAPTAFLVAWPLLVASAGAALSAMGERRPLWVRLALVGLGVVGVGWLAGMIHAVYVNLDVVELLALLAWLTAFVVWPFAHPRIGGAGRITALLVLGAGLLLLIAVRLDPPWSERHPQASLVYYVVDQDAGRAVVADATPGSEPWTRRLLESFGSEPRAVDATPVFREPLRGVPAPVIETSRPRLELSRAADRLVLNLAPPPGARTLVVELRSPQALSGVAVNGRPADLLQTPDQWSQVRWTGDPQGLRISFGAPDDSGQIEVRYAAISDGWHVGAPPLPPRPQDVMAFQTSDSLIVRGTRRLSW